MKAILGKKIGMTTLYTAEHGAQNVTLIQCEPNTVSCVRTPERDGYAAIRLTIPKTRRTVVQKEFRTEGVSDAPDMGAIVSLETFAVGDVVSVSGITKAKGFQGVVKRHGFAGAPSTHGHRHDHRAPGSLGCRFPQHVQKGKRMAGRMGGEKHTTTGLQIVLVDTERKMIAVRGAVPGVVGRVVSLVKA